jgi:hypothetical protein
MPEPDELKGMEPKGKEELTAKEEELANRERLIRERERELRTGVEPASVQEIVQAEMAEKKGGGGKSAFSLTSIIINVVLAAIVAYMMVGQFAITKSWYNANIAPALNTFDETYAKNSALGSYVLHSELAAALSGQATEDPYVTSGMLDTALEGVTAPDLSGYVKQADYDNALARIDVLEEEVDDLQVGGSGSGGDSEEPDDAITVDLGYSGYLTYPELDGALEQAIFFDVENNLEADVTEVELQLTLHSRGIAIPFDLGLCTVTEGYPLDWQIVYVGSGMVVLQGVTPPWGDGLKIDAEDTEAVYLTLNLGDTSSTLPDNNTRLYIEVECTDYTVPD